MIIYIYSRKAHDFRKPPNPPSVVALVAGLLFATEASSRDLRIDSSRESQKNMGETLRDVFSDAFFVEKGTELCDFEFLA